MHFLPSHDLGHEFWVESLRVKAVRVVVVERVELGFWRDDFGAVWKPSGRKG